MASVTESGSVENVFAVHSYLFPENGDRVSLRNVLDIMVSLNNGGCP